MKMPNATRLLLATSALVIIGGMPAMAREALQQTQQQAPAIEPRQGGQQGEQQIRQYLGDARRALEQEDRAAAELALRDAHAELEGMSGDAALPERDQLRTLIESALDALENEDFAEARQTVQQAEEMIGQQQAVGQQQVAGQQ